MTIKWGIVAGALLLGAMSAPASAQRDGAAEERAKAEAWMRDKAAERGAERRNDLGMSHDTRENWRARNDQMTRERAPSPPPPPRDLRPAR